MPPAPSADRISNEPMVVPIMKVEHAVACGLRRYRDAASFRSSAAVSSCTSMRAPPRLLPPALPSAESTGVLPRLSLALRSAPLATRNCTTSFQPQRAASCSGVRPRESLRVDVAAGLEQQLQRLDRSLLRVLGEIEAARVGVDRAEPGRRHDRRDAARVGQR